ncbi:MAG: hypothetical protein WCV67_03140 [Victivallaceae bacterium]|jgi:hypothetical protein
MLNRSRGGPVAKSGGVSLDDVISLLDDKADKIGADDIEITDAAKGIIRKSPDGTRRRETLDNDGTITREVL